MISPQVGAVPLDGVDLFYRTFGDGPPLLVLPGGVGDADATAALAAHLAETFRVIAHDRRGLGRSTADGPRPGCDPLTGHTRDAVALLDHLGLDRVAVVGASIGALVALHLLADHPDRVATVVAHEPPMTGLVRDPEREAALDEVAALVQAGDVGAAGGRMGALTGADDPREDGAPRPVPAGDPLASATSFFRHDFPAVRADRLDVAGLDRTRLHATGGVLSRARWEYHCARALADATSAPFHEVAGGHNPVVDHPAATAEVVRALLSAGPAPRPPGPAS